MSVRSFTSICDQHTHTLVLGTMPGTASLDAVKYYAHKRNAFWPIMLSLIDEVPPSYALAIETPYAQRVQKLTAFGIGLWDVLAECERKGSLDSAIQSDSIVVNDFNHLLQQYPNINTILFNGKTAQKLFQKHVIPELTGIDHIQTLDLPSTSPAMASLNLQEKSQRWHAAIKR